MKLSKLLKPILFTLSLSLLLGISLSDAVAGPLIIVTKTQCQGKTILNPNSTLTKFFLTLNSTTSSWYWNTSNNPTGFLYLYYRDPSVNNPQWQTNGIACAGSANGGFNYNIPIAAGKVYEIMLATGSTSANLGSSGSGPNQAWMKVTGCGIGVVDGKGLAPDPRLIPYEKH